MAGNFKDQGNNTVRVPLRRQGKPGSTGEPVSGAHNKKSHENPQNALPFEPQSSSSQGSQGSLWRCDLGQNADDPLNLTPGTRVRPKADAKPGAGSEPKAKIAGAAGKAATSNPNAGHRQRLRQRFREGGADALPDYELLEMILFRAMARRDTKPLAKRLIARFGSFAEVINAPIERLKEIDGVGDGVVDELKLVRAGALRVMRGEIMQKPALGSWDAVLGYCRAAMGFETREQFRILFLDKRNRLIADEVQQEGTVDHTPVYVREVVKRALEHSATAIILVHNHPSGDPTPSRADIDMTKMIMVAAKNLGIAVHDHIIVGKEGHTSMKGLRLI